MKKKSRPFILACMLMFSLSVEAVAQMQPADCVDLSVTLNEVTLVDKMRWGAQAILAPRQLENLVPLYAYPSDDMNIQEFIEELSQDIQASDFRIGRAVVQNQYGHDVWRGSPLIGVAGRLSDPDQLADQLASSLNPCINIRDGDLWYIVSEPVAHLNPDPKSFWAIDSQLYPNSTPQHPDL